LRGQHHKWGRKAIIGKARFHYLIPRKRGSINKERAMFDDPCPAAEKRESSQKEPFHPQKKNDGRTSLPMGFLSYSVTEKIREIG